MNRRVWSFLSMIALASHALGAESVSEEYARVAAEILRLTGTGPIAVVYESKGPKLPLGTSPILAVPVLGEDAVLLLDGEEAYSFEIERPRQGLLTHQLLRVLVTDSNKQVYLSVIDDEDLKTRKILNSGQPLPQPDGELTSTSLRLRTLEVAPDKASERIKVQVRRDVLSGLLSAKKALEEHASELSRRERDLKIPEDIEFWTVSLQDMPLLLDQHQRARELLREATALNEAVRACGSIRDPELQRSVAELGKTAHRVFAETYLRIRNYRGKIEDSNTVRVMPQKPGRRVRRG